MRGLERQETQVKKLRIVITLFFCHWEEGRGLDEAIHINQLVSVIKFNFYPNLINGKLDSAKPQEFDRAGPPQ